MTDAQRQLLEDNLSDAVYMLAYRMRYQSIWEKRFRLAGIDFDLLLACCEDNIVQCRGEETPAERIAYAGAIKDYEKSEARKKEKPNVHHN